MNDELNIEIKEIKRNLEDLSRIAQEFAKLTEYFSSNICCLSTSFKKVIEASKSDFFDSSQTSNSPDPRLKAKPQIRLKDYLIDYSFIEKESCLVWREKLEKHNKKMAECEMKKEFPSFCQMTRMALESAVKELFKYEYNNLCSENSSFLKAYNSVKEAKDRNGWDFPNIYLSFDGEAEITEEKYKEIGNSYISWEQIDKLLKTDFPASVEILFWMETPNEQNLLKISYLRNKFKLIKIMNNVRLTNVHDSDEKPNSEVENLKKDPKNFSKVKEVVVWFVEKVYTRISN